MEIEGAIHIPKSIVINKIDRYPFDLINSSQELHQKLIPNEVKYYKENYPINTLDNIYEALAWQGLKNHKVQAWLDKGKDTIKINNTINNC